MAKKKTEPVTKTDGLGEHTYIENAGIVIDQPVTETLVSNYMPYAMSVIVSRAIPEIDGFKPSHRKILYTMYKKGLINGPRIKSANAVGEVMKLHPHGDQAIYETMVRLARGNEALLHPYIDSKGNFGKCYSRDMAFAAARYTEMKLMPICAELFSDIDKDAVDMVDNYDGTLKEPVLLPAAFPSILVNSNVGIAVGMASSICPFNLSEICETTIALMRDPKHNIPDTLPAPDFPLGGQLLFDANELEKVYSTGRGTFRIRSCYNYDKVTNCLEISKIPPTTSIEAIIDKIVELVKQGKIKEISDIRDETDLGGLKIAIDLKRGTDHEKLIKRLFKMTPLEDNFSCNFNILIGSTPKVMGVREILEEWIAFRLGCVRRRLFFELKRKKDKLHLLEGLSNILLDIDKAVSIVRGTEEETEVVPNLMIGFGIDQIQSEFVAEIKLRQLNREYILKRTEETSSLREDIESMNETLESTAKLKQLVISELKAIAKKYYQPRRTEIIMLQQEDEEEIEDTIPDYPVHLFFTKEGYFKKITPQSYRMSSDHKLKDGDCVIKTIESSNRAHLLFFSDKGQVYKSQASDFDDTKASVLGDFIPAKLDFDDGESAIYMAVTTDYSGYMLFGFENGKISKVDMKSYETKTRRKKLTAAYYIKEKLTDLIQLVDDIVVLVSSSSAKIALIDTARLTSKTARETIGVAVLTLRTKATMNKMVPFNEEMLNNSHRFMPRTLPTAGYTAREEDIMEQLSL